MPNAKLFLPALTTAILGALLCSGCGTRKDDTATPTSAAPSPTPATSVGSAANNANTATTAHLDGSNSANAKSSDSTPSSVAPSVASSNATPPTAKSSSSSGSRAAASPTRKSPAVQSPQSTAHRKSIVPPSRKTASVASQPMASGTRYPFQVLGVSSSGASKELSYSLKFSRLPAENTLYDFYYSACTGQKTDASHRMGAGTIADYLKMTKGKIYGKVLGSTPDQNQYVLQNTVNGSMKIRASAAPISLVVRMYEWHPNKGAGKQIGTYFVPVQSKP